MSKKKPFMYSIVTSIYRLYHRIHDGQHSSLKYVTEYHLTGNIRPKKPHH